MKHWTLMLKRIRHGGRQLWTRSRVWCGIEITADTVRVAVVQRKGHVWHLRATLAEPITDDAETALRRVMARLKQRVHHAVMALPTDAVIRLTLDVSAEMSEAEVALWARQEVAQRTGLEGEALAIDFKRKTLNADRTLLTVVAARREHVSAVEAQAVRAGYPLRAVESEWHALERLCRYLPHQGAMIGLLVVTAQCVGLYVFQAEQMHTCRVVPCDMAPDVSAEQRNEMLIQHAQRAWSFVLAAGFQPHQLWLSGEYATLPLLAEQLSAHFQMTCPRVLLPDLPKGGALAFFTALGLALWGLPDG
ncbi:MAG: type IV pilus biogenesis protein PilM [Pseudomonas sp.]